MKLSKVLGVTMIINFIPSLLVVLRYYTFMEVQNSFRNICSLHTGKRTLTVFSENSVPFNKAHVITINVIKY